MKTTIRGSEAGPDSKMGVPCNVVKTEPIEVKTNDGPVAYLRITVEPDDEDLQKLRERHGGTFQIDCPAQDLTEDSFIGKTLERSNIDTSGEVDLQEVFNGRSMLIDFHRVSRFNPAKGETQRFWQADRGTMVIVQDD